MTRDAFAAVLPDMPVPSLPFMGAYGIGVASLDRAEAVLRRGGIAPRRMNRALVAPFPDALGIGAWVFVEAAADLPWRP